MDTAITETVEVSDPPKTIEVSVQDMSIILLMSASMGLALVTGMPLRALVPDGALQAHEEAVLRVASSVEALSAS